MSFQVCRHCDAPMVPFEELDFSPSVMPRTVKATPRSIRIVALGFTITLAAGVLAVAVGGVIRLWQWAV